MKSTTRTQLTRKSARSINAARKPSLRPSQPLTRRISELIPQIALACSLMGASHALAATVVWTGTGADDGWATSGNWTAGTVPGSTSGTTNGDYAFFNATSGTTHVTVDSGRNLAGLQFGGGSTLNYTIGDNAGNALFLSSGGQITVGGNNVNNPGANGLVFTVAAPLVIEGNSATYSFANWANNAVNPRLVLSGSITAAASSGTTTITLDGGNGANAITGAISDGALGAKVALNQTNTGGNWTLSGANTFTGPVTVNGTLKLTGSSGSLASTLFNLNAGTFTVDNTTAAGGGFNNRFSAGSGANFTLAGGAFVYKGSDAAGVSSTESIGTLNPSSGQSTFTMTYGGTNTATLNAAAFNRLQGQSVLLVNGLGLGRDSTSTASVSRLFLGSTPALAGNTAALDSGNGTDGLGTAAAQDTQIVPFLVGEATIASGGFGTATGNANTFVTYDAVTGLRPLNPTNEFVNNSITSGSGLGFNTYIKAATTGSASATINSVVINGGNLSIADGATLTNSSGALLFVSNNSIALGGTAGTGILDFGAAEGIVSVNNGITGTIATGITGSGGLTKAEAGTLVLTTSPSFTGTTSVTAGTLQIGNGGTAGALSSGPVAVANGANLTFNRTDTYGGSISPTIANAGSVNLVSGTLGFSGTISRPGSTGNLNVGVNSGNKAVLNLTGGSISSCLTLGGNGIGVVNQSGGIFTNTAESYIGGGGGGYGLYNLTSGTLNLQSFLQVGSDGTGLFYQSGGLVSQSGPAIDFPRNGGTGVLYLTSGTFSASAVLFTWAGNVGRGEVNVAGGLLASSGGVNFWNASPSTGVLNLDAGVLQTSSIYASSTGSSRVNFNGGTLRATASNGTLLGGVTSAVINSGGATIDTNGNTTTISQALLAPTGSGVSYVSISGTGYLGAPYVKITGDGTGATAVASLDGSGNILGIAITNPGVGYTSGTVTLVGGGGTVIGGTTLNLTANTSGGLTKNGAGTLTLSGSNTYTGTTTVNAGTLQVPIPAALASSTAVVVNNAGSLLAVNYGGASDYTEPQLTALLAETTIGASASFGIDTTNLSGTYGGVIGISGTLSKLGVNTLTLTGSNTNPGGAFINSGTLQIGGNGSLGGGNYAGPISIAGALVFNSTANQTLSGIVSGTGALTQSGPGTLILAGSDNFTGATTINAGTVQIGNGATGSVPTGNTVTINTGGTLAIDLANTGTFGNTIAIGSGALNAVATGTNTLSGNIGGFASGVFNQSGTGTTILSGNDSYFGPTNINAGVLQLNAAGAANNSTVTVGVNNGLAFGVTAATIGALAGSGNIALLSGSSAVTLTAGGNNATTSYSGSLSGGGTLTKTGTGTLTLAGTNSVLAALDITGGAINFSGGVTSASNNGLLHVAPNAGNKSVLNITGGSIGGVTLRIGDSGIGVVNQSGGYVISNGPNEFFLGSGGYGAYNLTSGTLASTNWFQIGGGTGSVGIFKQTGGVVNYTGSGIEVPRYNNGTGVLYLNGGLFNSTAGISFGYDGGTGRGEVTVASGTLAVANNLYFQAAGITGILNLDGGVTAVNGIFKSGASTTGIVNFNGGTLRTTFNNGIYLGSSSTSTNAVNAAYVYGGGAIIDTYGNSETFYQNLLAPAGNGVSSISVTGTGYTGAPYVQITGDGTGATGIANLDGNGNITGITITNPGVGYTSGTVTLVGGGGVATTTGTVNFVTNTSGGLTKTGAGTLALAGSNTYTGATTVYGGNLVLSNTNGYTGTTTINPTTSLTLNFSAATAAQTNIINAGSALALGGTLTLTGSANATNSQTFNGTSLLPGASAIVMTASTSNPLALKLGSSFTHNTGGTVDFTLPTGTQSASNGILTTATNVSFTGGSNTILGGWATVGGTTWAVSGTSGASTNISGLTTYNSGLAAGTDVEAGNLGTIAPATMTINSLRFNTAGSTTLNLGGPLTIASGGILRTSNASADVNFNNSTITSGNGSDLTVINNQGGNWIQIASQIVGSIGLTKSGAGSLSLTGNNTFNGTVNLNAGILYISNSRALGTGGTGSLVFNGGALYLGSFGNAGSFSQDVSSKIAPVGFGQYAAINTNSASVSFGTAISGAGGLEKLGGGYLALTATNTYTGSTWIAGGYLTFSSLSNFGNGGSGGIKFQYGGLQWANGSTADISSLSLSNAGDTYFDTNGNNVAFNNAIAAGSINWTFKDGLGTLDLQNTYGNAGGFIERGGTVNIDFAGASAPATNILSNGTEIRFNGGRVLITGKPGATNSETFGLWNLGVNGTGAGTLQFAQNGAAALNATLGTMNQRSVGNTLNIIPATTGTLTYTGGSASTILLSSGVPYATVNGSDWAASNAANNAIVGLSAAGGAGYTNSTSTTLSGNADIATGTDTTLTASGTTTTLRFNQNQARSVTLSSTASLSTGGILVTPSVATAGSLITGGTLTASNNSGQDLVVFQNSPQPFTIASVIGNINGANGLTKSGTGNLILSGNNTYTGATNIDEGTLTLTGTRTGTTAAGTINVNGGTLAVTGGLLNTAGNTINIGAASSSVGSFNISGGTVFTAANLTLGNNQSGQGILNQSGGNFIDGNVFQLGQGVGSFGALNLSGGVLTKLGSELWLGTGGSALVNISGGVMNLTNGTWVNPSRAQGANYTAFVLSGSGVLNTGNGLHENWGQNGGTVIVTVKDNAWFNETNNALSLGYLGGLGILNVAGGVTTLNNIQTSTGDVQNSSFVNFNGGILQATNGGQGSFISGLTAATIYGGGATIDTMVFGNNVTIPQPLLAPTGNGIGSLTVTGNTSGFLSAPIVQISGGGGTGASALANIDGSGNLTGFTIVSPGSGYTSAPTVTLVGGGVALPTVTGSLASNAGTGGGLTKLGQSSLTLSGSNNYTGTTTVTNGSLIFAPAANVTQSFGALAFNGGDGTVQSTFNSGSNALTFSSLAARPAGATRTFIVSGGTPTGATPTNIIVLTGQAAGFIDQGTFYGTSTGGNYAWYDSTNNYVRGITYGTDAGSVTSGATTSLSGTYVQTTGAVSAQTTGTFATLNISGNNGPFTLATGATLTVNGILKTGNNGWYNVTGGTGIQAASNAELVVRVDQGGDGLHIYNSILANGTNALTKTGAGGLWLSGSNTYTGATNLAGGVLTFDTPYALGTGSIVFKGGTLQYNGGFGGPVPDLSSRFSAIGANLNAVVDTNGFDVIYASPIAGPGSFQKNGTGTLTLSGSNTFGDLNLVGGVVNFANLNNLGTGKLVFNGGTLQYAPGNTADLSTRNVFLYGNATVDTNGNNVTFANPVGATGGGAFTKIGAGTLRLTANNVWQGVTNVNEGTLQLDFSTTPGANQASLLSTNSNLTLAGGTLLLTGAANATNSQSVNGANFNAGASAIQLNANASSNPLLLTLNGFGRAAAGTLNITLPTGTQSASNGVTTTSTTLVSNNVLVSAASNGIAFATVSGSDWASLSGNNIIPLAAANYATDSFVSGSNSDLKTAQAPAAFTVNTLRVSGAGAASALTLASGTNVVNTGGILVTSAATGATIGGSGSIAPGAGKELVIIDNGALTVTAPIANNAAGASALTLAGSGTTTLNGNNSYTGATVIDNGTVILGGSNSLGATLAVNGGTLQITGTLNAGTQPIYIANTSGARAVVNVVSGGALNFNGGNLDLGTQAGAANVAVLNQSGGIVSGSAVGVNAFAIGQVADSYGAYNITGGNITAGEISIGLSGVGLLTQTSGTFTATNFFNLDRGVGSVGIANLSGGTLVGPAAGVCVGVSGRGELNVSGSATVNNAGHPLLVAGGQPGYGVGIVNLLGGTVLTDSLLQYYGTTSTGIFNFSGGTLKANVGNGAFLQGLTAAYINGAFGSYSGGAVLDTGSNNITIGQNLLAPTGNGVSLSGLAVSGSGYLGAPVVQLVGGGGFGATAVANIDANGNLTGIAITNPGVGYTSAPTVQLIGGGGLPVVTGNPSLVANTGGGLTKNGAGTLTLAGSNTYTGATTINGGVVQITSDAQLGAVPASPSTNIVLNGGQLVNNNSSPSLAANRNLSLTGSGGFIDAGWGPATFTVNGQISGSAGLSVVWDSGVTVLGGSNNYAGATTIGATGNLYWNNGAANPTVRLGNNNALPGTDLIFGTSTAANTATLDLNGFNAAVAALSGSTNAVVDVLSSGTSTLTVGNNNASSTFQGSLRNTTGTLALFKTGTGTLTLNGANTYSGGTTVNNGTLVLVGAGNPNNRISGAISVSAGATLQLNNSNLISSTGVVTLNGGTFALQSYGDYFQGLNLNGNSAVTSSAGIILEQASPTINVTGTNNTISAPVGLTSAFAAVAGSKTLTVNVTNSGDALTVSGGIANLSFDGGGAAASIGGISKTGAGVLTFTGSNTYTGTTTIYAGTLQLGNGGTTGSLSPSSAIANNATLVFKRANTLTQGTDFAAISGSGNVVQAGAGRTILSGSNSYSGGTTVNGGTLQVGNANALGTGSLTVNAGTLDLNSNSTSVGALSGSAGIITNSGTGTGTLTTAASGTSTYAGNITDGAGAVVLTNSGSGTLILSGSLTMAGFNADGGVTQLTQSGSIGAVNVAAGATLSLAAHSGSNYNVLDVSSLAIGGSSSAVAAQNTAYTHVDAATQNYGGLTPAGVAVTKAAAADAAAPASPEAVPEPGALGLLLTGAIGLLGFRRKAKKAAR